MDPDPGTKITGTTNSLYDKDPGFKEYDDDNEGWDEDSNDDEMLL